LPIPDLGVKKAPDPGSVSATLLGRNIHYFVCVLRIKFRIFLLLLSLDELRPSEFVKMCTLHLHPAVDKSVFPIPVFMLLYKILVQHGVSLLLMPQRFLGLINRKGRLRRHRHGERFKGNFHQRFDVPLHYRFRHA
jgi:hypothetical protein